MMATVDSYLDALDEPQRRELERIRRVVAKHVPEAVQLISYGIPGFKYEGKYLMGYAAFRDHLSIFPTAGPIEVLATKLSDYKLARGTIQFRLDKPLPETLIQELLDVRVEAIGC